MHNFTDPKYLVNSQYRDAANLNARIALHTRFATDAYPWQRWVFDQLALPAGARVLELGSGPGRLWIENADRLPPDWEITLSDLSPGMVAEAQANLATAGRSFQLEQIDAQAIPFPAADFDAVIANHMLYHVPDRTRALAEIRRVLRPGGQLYATTVGQRHMAELADLVRPYSVEMGLGADMAQAQFTVQSGGAELARFFDLIECRVRENTLSVTEIEPLLAYAASGGDLTAAQEPLLRAEVQRRIAADGAERITTETGLFIATKAETGADG